MKFIEAPIYCIKEDITAKEERALKETFKKLNIDVDNVIEDNRNTEVRSCRINKKHVSFYYATNDNENTILEMLNKKNLLVAMVYEEFDKLMKRKKIN